MNKKQKAAYLYTMQGRGFDIHDLSDTIKKTIFTDGYQAALESEGVKRLAETLKYISTDDCSKPGVRHCCKFGQAALEALKEWEDSE